MFEKHFKNAFDFWELFEKNKIKESFAPSSSKSWC